MMPAVPRAREVTMGQGDDLTRGGDAGTVVGLVAAYSTSVKELGGTVLRDIYRG